MMDVAIIGGGICGLSSGYYLQTRAPDTQFRIFESSSSLGGKIGTDLFDTPQGSLLLEKSADSFLTHKPMALRLAHELGLTDVLLPTQKERTVYILRNGALCPMPQGLKLVVPTQVGPLLSSSLFSGAEKLRILAEMAVRPKPGHLDESVADFFIRRFGLAAFHYLAEPLLSGIYSSNPYKQSMRACFPQFLEMEQRHSSLILAAMKERQQSQSQPTTTAFVSFKGGMQTLIDALSQRLSSHTRVGTGIVRIHPSKEGGYDLLDNHGQWHKAKEIILTTPADVNKSLLETAYPVLAKRFGEIRATRSACVFLTYDRNQVAHNLKGYGVLVPHQENRPINAITWVSSKLSNRAPESTALFRLFFGGERKLELLEHTDETLIGLAQKSCESILEAQGAPSFAQVYRHHRGNPQYDVGHLERVRCIEAALPLRMHLASSSFYGVGIPDCVQRASDVVDKLLATLQTAPARWVA